jgi:DNA-binding response OmpR family regulator
VLLRAGEITLADASNQHGLGADGWILKPFVREVLIASVDRLLADRA